MSALAAQTVITMNPQSFSCLNHGTKHSWPGTAALQQPESESVHITWHQAPKCNWRAHVVTPAQTMINSHSL